MCRGNVLKSPASQNFLIEIWFSLIEAVLVLGGQVPLFSNVRACVFDLYLGKIIDANVCSIK